MKYYTICAKILGGRKFEELANELTRDITVKFSGEILLDEYIGILDINIKVILISAICKVLELDEEQKNKKINIAETEKYIVTSNMQEMEKKYKKYIIQIQKILEN